MVSGQFGCKVLQNSCVMLPLNPRDLFMLLETMVQAHVSAVSVGRYVRGGRGRRNGTAVSLTNGRSLQPYQADTTHPMPPLEWEQAKADLLKGLRTKKEANRGRAILGALEPYVSHAWESATHSHELSSRISEFIEMFDALDQGIVILHSDGTIRHTNQQACKLLRLSVTGQLPVSLPPLVSNWVTEIMRNRPVVACSVKMILDIVPLKVKLELRPLAADRYILLARPARPSEDISSLMGQGFSERQAEVLTLILRGATNREIAKNLFISPRTVEKHVENILSTLDVSTRSAAISKIMAQREASA